MRHWLRGDGPRAATQADLDYHLSTLFPPVRPRGFLELRVIDAQRQFGREQEKRQQAAAECLRRLAELERAVELLSSDAYDDHRVMLESVTVRPWEFDSG